jgi:hypothetical protein
MFAVLYKLIEYDLNKTNLTERRCRSYISDYTSRCDICLARGDSFSNT